MQVMVWKCEETGEIFEAEADYLEHVSQLQSQRTITQQRERLEALRKEVFDSAKSMDSLFHRIMSGYGEVISLLVALGELGTESTERKLVDVQTGNLRFKEYPSAVSGYEPCIEGAVTFVYTGAQLEDDIDDVFNAFPALLGKSRCPEEPLSCTLEDGKLLQARRILVPVSSMRRLAQAYADYLGLHPKRRSLSRSVAERVEELAQSDPAITALRKTIDEMKQELKIRQQSLDTLNEKHQQVALAEFDEMRRYLKVRELLRMPEKLD
jgi:hypothetical protein